MMSTDRKSARGNKRARVTRGSRNPKHGKRKALHCAHAKIPSRLGFHHIVSALLRYKDFKHLTLMNAMDPTTFIVWWLESKAEVCNKQGFVEFWSATSTYSTRNHASVFSLHSQISQNNQAKTKLMYFVSSADPQRGRRVVDALLVAFLPSPRFRYALLIHAMDLTM
jgi:hypothetical protein